MKKVLLPYFYKLLVRPWLKYIIGVQFENEKVISEHDQYIIIANHNSHFDTVSILASLPSNKLLNTFPIAAGDYFGRNKLTKWATQTLLNTLHINRARTGEGVSAISILNDELAAGKSLVLFPEGTRGRPGVVEDYKSGIAVLLKKNPGLPFIPVYLLGFGRVLPKNKSMIIPLNCKVRYGKPVIPDPNMSVDEILALTKQSILALKKADERDYNKFESE